MHDLDVHVTRGEDAYWTVAFGKNRARKSLGRFRVRSHALAFGRAVAHRGNVELIVHESDGRSIRHAAESLTYPATIK